MVFEIEDLMSLIGIGSVVRIRSGTDRWTVGRIFEDHKLGQVAYCVNDDGREGEFPIAVLEIAVDLPPAISNHRVLPGGKQEVQRLGP